MICSKVNNLFLKTTSYFSAFFEKRSRKILLRRRYGDRIDSFTNREIKYLGLVTECLDRLDEPIGVVYDIGASRGIWAEAFALYTNKPVFAFEPLPSMVGELETRRRRCPNISIQPFACGLDSHESIIYEDMAKVEASSLLEMTDISRREFAQSGLGDTRQHTIRVVSLDQCVRNQGLPMPSLIKVDVQGYELKAIEGGIDTFKKAMYVWIELCIKPLYKEGSTFRSCYSLLSSLGFELIDCVELARSVRNKQLLYMDGIFRNVGLSAGDNRSAREP